MPSVTICLPNGSQEEGVKWPTGFVKRFDFLSEMLKVMSPHGDADDDDCEDTVDESEVTETTDVTLRLPTFMRDSVELTSTQTLEDLRMMCIDGQSLPGHDDRELERCFAAVLLADALGADSVVHFRLARALDTILRNRYKEYSRRTGNLAPPTIGDMPPVVLENEYNRQMLLRRSSRNHDGPMRQYRVTILGPLVDILDGIHAHTQCDDEAVRMAMAHVEYPADPLFQEACVQYLRKHATNHRSWLDIARWAMTPAQENLVRDACPKVDLVRAWEFMKQLTSRLSYKLDGVAQSSLGSDVLQCFKDAVTGEDEDINAVWVDKACVIPYGCSYADRIDFEAPSRRLATRHVFQSIYADRVSTVRMLLPSVDVDKKTILLYAVQSKAGSVLSFPTT